MYILLNRKDIHYYDSIEHTDKRIFQEIEIGDIKNILYIKKERINYTGKS